MTILKEGGNIFKTPEGPITQRIGTGDVESTVKFIEKITGLDFTAEVDPTDKKPVKWLGSTGRKEDPDGTFELNSSGDLDLSVDLADASKIDVIAKLSAWLKSQGIDEVNIMNAGNKKTDGWIKDAGDQVHFRTPIAGNSKNGFVQTDFMFTNNPKFQQGSLRGTGKGPYKGMHRMVILSSIARARGVKFSPKFGLVDPESNEPIPGGDNWANIAKKLLGPSATEQTIRTPEAIIDFIKKLPNYEELIGAARETLAKDGIELPKAGQIESLADKHLSRLKELLGHGQ